MLAEHGDSPEDPIPIAIETSRGHLVTCLQASGRRVYAINPMAVARYRHRHVALHPSTRSRPRRMTAPGAHLAGGTRGRRPHAPGRRWSECGRGAHRQPSAHGWPPFPHRPPPLPGRCRVEHHPLAEARREGPRHLRRINRASGAPLTARPGGFPRRERLGPLADPARGSSTAYGRARAEHPGRPPGPRASTCRARPCR